MSFRNISVAVTATDGGLNTTLARAGTTVDAFGRRVERSGRVVNTTTAGMSRGFTGLDHIISRGVNRSLTGFVVAATGGYAAGRALKSGLDALIGGAVQFDARMRNVNSIAHLSETQLHLLGDEVLDLSKRLPQSANTLSEGLYDIQSSGFAGTQGLIVLNASARAASAGLTDTSTSAQAVAGVLNAYGEQAGQAQNVSDSLFKTVDVGVLSFADLAQGIGQVVGTAAAGKVDIDDLGQAIATMTKAGIVPAEAFTSANQLLAQIIQPGEALAGVFRQLGYESGAAALEQKGLFGVMRDIQQVTRGDVTTTSQLFTDIRSLRGALALGTDQGKLYAGVVREWDSAHKGAGATAAAFAEQQKSVAFQWQVLKNEAQAAAISAGTEVLPELIHLMHGVEALGHVLSNDGVQKFLLLAGAIYVLNKAINAGIAIRNSTLVTAVARQVGASTAAAGAITAEAAAAGRAIPELEALALAENEAAIAAGRMAAAGKGATAGTVIGAGMAANLGSGAGLSGKLVRGGAYALGGQAASSIIPGPVGRVARDTLYGAALGSVIPGIGTAVGAVGGATFGTSTEVLRAVFGHGGSSGSDDQAVLANLGAGTRAVLDPLIEQYGSLDTALKVLKETNHETEVSQRQLGISHKLTTGNIEEELAALQALQKQRDDWIQSVSSAFAGAVDVTQQFNPETGQQAITSAQQQLLDAQRSLRQQQAQVAAAVAGRKGHAPTVSEEQQLANARRNVANATTALADAQRQAAQTGDLSTIYQHNIDMARQFVADVHQAETRDLDPQLIARLLQQGPEQAGPLLDAIVSDHSNRMIQLANRNEDVLRRIGARTVRYAQFVNNAVNAPLEDQARLARELPDALKLDEELRNMPAPATGAWLAKQLGMTPPQIRRLAEDFGITLPAFVQRTLNRHPVEVKVHFKMPPGYVQGPTGVFVPRGAADGGLITGPGTGTSDSILARLSNREYVQPEKAVAHYGVGFMDDVRRLRLPRFADGGMWGTARPVMGGGGSGGASVVVHHHHHHEKTTAINVGEVRAHDYRDFRRQMATELRARRAVSR